jgi:hypothetical protein
MIVMKPADGFQPPPGRRIKAGTAVIREIHDVGYKAATIDQLVRMRIHEVDAEFIRQLQADGYQT